MNKQYLSAAEAAEELNVCRSTVYRWIDSGRLKAYRVGPQLIRIDPADLTLLATPLDGGHAA